MDHTHNHSPQSAGPTQSTGADMIPPSPVSGGPQHAPGGAGEHKTWAVLGYILPFLFFVPLLSEAKNHPYVKYHANQQLNLLLYWVLGNIVSSVILVVWPIVIIFGIVLVILGALNASRGDMKPLPLIGKFELLK